MHGRGIRTVTSTTNEKAGFHQLKSCNCFVQLIFYLNNRPLFSFLCYCFTHAFIQSNVPLISTIHHSSRYVKKSRTGWSAFKLSLSPPTTLTRSNLIPVPHCSSAFRQRVRLSTTALATMNPLSTSHSTPWPQHGVNAMTPPTPPVPAVPYSFTDQYNTMIEVGIEFITWFPLSNSVSLFYIACLFSTASRLY